MDITKGTKNVYLTAEAIKAIEQIMSKYNVGMSKAIQMALIDFVKKEVE